METHLLTIPIGFIVSVLCLMLGFSDFFQTHRFLKTCHTPLRDTSDKNIIRINKKSHYILTLQAPFQTLIGFFHCEYWTTSGHDIDMFFIIYCIFLKNRKEKPSGSCIFNGGRYTLFKSGPRQRRT